MTGGIGDHRLHFDGKITINILRPLHDGHQGPLLFLQLRNDLHQLSFLLCRSLKRNGALFFCHFTTSCFLLIFSSHKKEQNTSIIIKASL